MEANFNFLLFFSACHLLCYSAFHRIQQLFRGRTVLQFPVVYPSFGVAVVNSVDLEISSISENIAFASALFRKSWKSSSNANRASSLEVVSEFLGPFLPAAHWMCGQSYFLW